MSNPTRPMAFHCEKSDLQHLVSHPDRDVRAGLAQKICRQIRISDLSSAERTAVHKILTIIARDAAAIVRRALAVTLKNSPHLPKDVAKRLIKDVDSIAVPILEFSPVLCDEDLLEVLRSKAAAKMLAISRRAHISGDLVRAIVRFGDRRTIASVAANDGAQLGANLGSNLVTLYKDDDLIMESFIARRELPPLVIEKLITAVSAEAAIRLHERHEIPLDVSLDIARRSRERASIDFVAQSWVASDIPKLTQRLQREDRLTTSLIVRAACCGQMRFVESALAVKSAISLQKAVLMVHDAGPLGLKTICGQAGFSDAQTRLFHASVVIFKDLEGKGGVMDKNRFQALMLERVLSLPITVEQPDIDYFLEKLDRVSV